MDKHQSNANNHKPVSNSNDKYYWPMASHANFLNSEYIFKYGDSPMAGMDINKMKM